VKARVLIRPKAGVLDPQGDAVRDALTHLGFDVETARLGRLVELELPACPTPEARAAVDRMSAELLANPLIETYEIELA
jgi:phosphoribosylformylglycinamidine synthase